MKRAACIAVAGVLMFALALPARAATSQVEMTSAFKFSPTPVSVAMGDSVQWSNTSAFQHTATQDKGFFNTGTVDPAQSETKVFKWAGIFPYHCMFHGGPGTGMHGKIKVPDEWLNEGPQVPGDVQHIRVASEKAPDPLAFDVQIKRPGDDAFGPFKQKIKNAVVNFTPTEAGEYQFRSRVHRLSNNKVSGWSTPAFVEIGAV